MESIDNLETANINTLWMQNIYENIKNIEDLLRIAKEGVPNLVDFLQIPINQRDIQINEARYKATRLIITEMELLLSDSSPILKDDKYETFMKRLGSISKAIRNKGLFIKTKHSASTNTITGSSTSRLLEDTIDFLAYLRTKIILELKEEMVS